MSFSSKKICQIVALLILASALLLSCKNGFFHSYESGQIEFTLPYCSSDSQAREAAGESYNFEITFVHTASGAKTVLKAKSGETVTLKDAAPGSYEITAQGFDPQGSLQCEGSATAEVQKGKTTSVELVLKLKRILRVWTKNADMRVILDTFFNEHQDYGYELDYKSFNDDEEYYNALEKALSGNAPNAPDIYFVEPHRIYDFVKGDYKDYAMPYENLGINTEQALDEAQIVSYIQTLGTDYTDLDNPVLKALGYQSTISFYAYNKELARNVLGTDDPAEVEKELFRGGDREGDITWNNFINKASTIKDNYTINVTSGPEYFAELLCGCGGVWYDPTDSSLLNLSQKRQDTLNAVVGLSNYTRQNDAWSEGWFNDMENGEVLGFFGPSWLVSYTLKGGDNVWGICRAPVDYYWGGYLALVNNRLAEKKKSFVKDFIYWYALDTSPNGLMYRIASREFDGYTDAVASLKVQEEVNQTVPFLGDSRMFDIYKEAALDFSINTNAGKYHNQICPIIIDSIYDIEFESYGTGKMQVDIANSTDLDLDADSINNLPNDITVSTANSNGIKFSSSDNPLYIKETSSEICAGFTNDVVSPYTMYYPFTEAGRWYFFEVNNYYCAVKAKGGMSCPVTWDEEYFGYENNWGESEYIDEEAEITNDGENKTLSFSINNKFADYITSNVSKMWLDSYGEWEGQVNWEELYNRNCKGDTNAPSYIPFPTDSQGSTEIVISGANYPNLNSIWSSASYFIYVAVDFQVDKYNNTYFRIPPIQSKNQHYYEP